MNPQLTLDNALATYQTPDDLLAAITGIEAVHPDFKPVLLAVARNLANAIKRGDSDAAQEYRQRLNGIREGGG